MAGEKSCPAAAWQGFSGACGTGLKAQALVKRQEAGERTGVCDSAQKGANRLDCRCVLCPVVRLFGDDQQSAHLDLRHTRGRAG
jgi:hypothetical protein